MDHRGGSSGERCMAVRWTVPAVSGLRAARYETVRAIAASGATLPSLLGDRMRIAIMVLQADGNLGTVAWSNRMRDHACASRAAALSR
jgi:hypothetical protein